MTDSKSTSRLRFSLRTLLAVVALVAVECWLSMSFYPFGPVYAWTLLTAVIGAIAIWRYSAGLVLFCGGMLFVGLLAAADRENDLSSCSAISRVLEFMLEQLRTMFDVCWVLPRTLNRRPAVTLGSILVIRGVTSPLASMTKERSSMSSTITDGGSIA